MNSNKYLYDTDEVPEIPAEIIVRRIELLGDNLTELLEVHYFVRDNSRINAVLKAIEFWEGINDK